MAWTGLFGLYPNLGKGGLSDKGWALRSYPILQILAKL